MPYRDVILVDRTFGSANSMSSWTMCSSSSSENCSAFGYGLSGVEIVLGQLVVGVPYGLKASVSFYC